MKRIPMNSKPIRWFAKQLIDAQNPDDIIESWLFVNEQFRGYNAICVLPELNAEKYIDDVLRRLSNESEFISPYFYMANLYFVDNTKLHIMMRKRAEIRFRIDFSITMDSNFASYIDRLVHGGDLSTVANDVEYIIGTLLTNDYHYDYSFYLIENLKKYNGNITDTDILLENEAEVERTLLSLELFKSINTEKYRETKEIHYSITKKRAAKNARKTITKFYHKQKGREFLKYYYDFHKQIFLLLLIMVKVDFSSKRNQKKKFHEFLDDVIKDIGVFFDREFRIAWEYYNPKSRLRIFRRIQRGKDPEQLFDDLENIAWDLLVPRVLEANIPTRGSGEFYVPYFLSMDKGLLEVLKLYQVKAVIYGDSMKNFSVLPVVSGDDFLMSTGLQDLEGKFIESKEMRKNTYESLWEKIDELIEEYKVKIRQLLI